ncbi:putative quinol monooxygenase [Lactiplantibacillus songbeiensis]|uniref:Quinol monooxygenase n=2 Tax=Lactiplantibacillus songbeiensis TaxID=2559920 RepID=A0ABW4C1L9_9LACO
MRQAPLFRLFRLKIKPTKRAAFLAAGQHNLQQSIATEAGTLAMYTGHTDNAGTDNVVLEVYRDAASYNVHANSPQFKAFKQLAAQTVVSQTLTTLRPQVLMEQGPALKATEQPRECIRLAEYTVATAQLTSFRAAVLATNSQIMAMKQGLVANYWGQVSDDLQRWLQVTIFKDSATEQQVAQDQQFQKQFVSDYGQPKLTVIHPDGLVNQGLLAFKA